ncbi:MAG: hypothetical protein ACR2QK_21970 [Acidimicrobiales bacterium]
MISTRRHSFMSRAVRLTSVAAAMLALILLTVTRSEAAFTATTSNTANSIGTGTVVLTDDDSGSAAFTSTDLSPGNALVECITVTYSGNLLPAPVRLYGTTTGTADTYLDTTIEVGTGGSFGSCGGFSPTSTIYTGTLASFSSTHTDYASGIAVFTAAANPTSRTLRLTIDVQDNQAAQGLTSTADFIFEAQG